MSTFNPPADIAQITLAKSSDVNAIKAATAIAFGLLPSETKLQRGTVNFAADTGTANSYVVTLDASITSYTDGLQVVFRPLNSNTDISTINLNGIGIRSIRLTNSDPIQAGDISAGAVIDVRYSTATGFFHLTPNSAIYAHDAGVSADAAAASAVASAGSASDALSYRNSAEGYKNTAVSSAAAASSSAVASAGSASDALSYRNSAEGYKNAAGVSADAASSSASSAAAAYDSFDDRYLGAKASDPTLDNDGNALLTGALYWNTTSSEMRVYSGSAWVTAYLPATGYLALSGGTMTGAITFAAGQTISGYLPLAGGTMTGNITFNSTQFGTGVGTFLSTPSSANLAAALTDETGTGNAVFATSPTLVTPILGTPTSGDLSNCTNAVGYGLKSATTTVSISGATAPSTGQILTATDSTTATWQTPASSSVWVYLSTVTASGATTADIETTFDSTYNAYVLVASNVATSGGGASTQILCRQKIGGVYKTSSYAYAAPAHSTSGAATFGGSGAYIAVTPSSSTDITCADFVMYIYSPSSSTITNALHWQGMALGSATFGFAGGGNNSTGVLTGVRFYTTSTGTISGTFRLYGIKNS